MNQLAHETSARRVDAILGFLGLRRPVKPAGGATVVCNPRRQPVVEPSSFKTRPGAKRAAADEFNYDILPNQQGFVSSLDVNLGFGVCKIVEKYVIIGWGRGSPGRSRCARRPSRRSLR